MQPVMQQLVMYCKLMLIRIVSRDEPVLLFLTYFSFQQFFLTQLYIMLNILFEVSILYSKLSYTVNSLTVIPYTQLDNTSLKTIARLIMSQFIAVHCQEMSILTKPNALTVLLECTDLFNLSGNTKPTLERWPTFSSSFYIAIFYLKYSYCS